MIERYRRARMAAALLFVAMLTAALLWAQQPAMQVVITLTPQVDVFQTATQTYTLSKTPGTISGGMQAAQVFVNGSLMLAGLDYTLNGTTLTFTAQDTADMDAPVIQVCYWTAGN